MRLRYALVLLSSVAFAQSRTPVIPAPEPTGSVTGHVFCADTNQPARFARVSLEPVHEDAAKPSSPGGASSAPSTTVQTSVDGSFTLSKVKPGAYYVIAEKDGYINPRAMFSAKEMDDTSSTMRSLIDHALTRVQVDNVAEHAEIRLERGAAISGKITYDDGTPAGELRVKLLHKDEKGKWVELSGYSRKYGTGITTDDRGNFRMSSLLPDEYMIETDLALADTKTSSMHSPDGRTMEFRMMNFRFSLPFYGAGTPQQSEATTFVLRAGVELNGRDVNIPLSKLHRLTGRVLAGKDAHQVSAADLTLVMRDTGKQLATADISREDGLFHFEFVPDGDYVLKVTNARDAVWEPEHPAPGTPPSPFPPEDKERVLETFGSTQQPIILRGDQLSTLVTVPPDAKPDPKTDSASNASATN